MVALGTRDAATEENSIELICQINPITVALDQDSISIPVFLNNNTQEGDSVAGFELWVEISNPELVKFKILSSYWLYDSTCAGYDQAMQCTLWIVDSFPIATAPVDTVGTLTQGSGWNFTARVLTPDAGVIKVTGISPPGHGAIPPIAGVLCRLLAETNGVLGDSVCDSVTVQLTINRGQTRFSNTLGNTIPCTVTEVIDTQFFNCLIESSGVCIGWQDTTVDTFAPCLLDTSRILFVDGELQFDCCDWLVGDSNGDGIINISDLTYLLCVIFIWPSPCPISPAADFNCNGIFNIADVVYGISYIFSGGPPPPCHCYDL